MTRLDRLNRLALQTQYMVLTGCVASREYINALGQADPRAGRGHPGEDRPKLSGDRARDRGPSLAGKRHPARHRVEERLMPMVQAATAIAETLLKALLAAALGTWTLGSIGIWVRDDGVTEDDAEQLAAEGAAA